MQIKTLLLISIALRLALIGYGELQDRLLPVKYTDIDYIVFTDAARFVSDGKSPFLRSTYRYSPLLAYLLLPNVLLCRVWGKLLFAGADILAAWQIWRIGQLQQVSQPRCFWSIVLWLYNPFTATISTRGSCDSLATVILLAVLLLLMQGQRLTPALLYGLAVHFRVYPIVYAPAIVLYLAHRQQRQQQQHDGAQVQDSGSASSSRPCQQQTTTAWLLAVLQQGLAFGCPAAAVFLLLGLGFYQLYGQGFLHEAFLHHLVRKDPRHSFSMYYYSVYLEFMTWPGTMAAVPQAVLLLVLAVALHRNPPLCWLLQTMAFVAFNKVCTAQYFVWYYSLLPVALQRMPWPLPKALQTAGVVWAVAQLHWLFWGYLLEFQGAAVHLALWWAGALFLMANTAFIRSCQDRIKD
ncbi:PIG-M-domain-containing protein [Scenedesmus sp. NREL 46B-D3]|nr:PIG-M-domain-containing protein [Scenedesmus sp. NREL 46B-D3]